MTVDVGCSPILRERAGRDEVELELADGATVADAIAALARACPASTDVLGRLPVDDGRQPRATPPTDTGSPPATSWR